MTALLEAVEVTAAYGSRTVLQALSLAIEPATVTGVIGVNGSGKSTLLKVLAGILTPRGGVVRAAGKPVAALPRRQLARLVTLVPQDAPTGFALPVREVVAMGRLPYLGRFARPGLHDFHIVDAAMAAAGVGHLADRAITTLSGGERQRVFIARALAQETPVVLWDEPTASLDVRHQHAAMEQARQMAAGGRAVLAAIHDFGLASRYCGRLVCLGPPGTPMLAGPPAEIIRPEVLRAYFGVEAEVITHAATGTRIAVPLPLAPASGGAHSP